MIQAQLKLKLAELNLDFIKRLESGDGSVTFLRVGEKKYQYIDTDMPLKILYHPRYVNVESVHTLIIKYVTTDHRGQLFFGYTTECGHDVYIRADDDFFNRIVSIEE